MKTCAFPAFFVIFSFFLCIQAFSRTYMDDMTDTDNNHIKQHSGFELYAYGRGPDFMIDRTVFRFANIDAPSAWIKYRVTDATEVTAAIYSPVGTFVLPNRDNPSQYLLGISGADNSALAATPAMKQALFSKASNAVYTNLQGLAQLVYDGNYYVFGPPLSPPQGELTGYGVNIYYSTNGVEYIKVPSNITHVEFEQNNNLVYEEYMAFIPASATYVMVELNDVTSVPAITGNDLIKTAQTFISLASVTIYGERLLLGEQEPLVLESPPSDDYDWLDELLDALYDRASESSSRESSVSQSKSESSKIQAESKAPESSKPKSPGASKFEGTIRASSSSKAPPSKSEAPESKEASTIEITDEYEPPKTEVIEMPRELPEQNRLNKGVTGYIAVVSGAIIITFLTPKKK